MISNRAVIRRRIIIHDPIRALKVLFHQNSRVILNWIKSELKKKNRIFKIRSAVHAQYYRMHIDWWTDEERFLCPTDRSCWADLSDAQRFLNFFFSILSRWEKQSSVRGLFWRFFLFFFFLFFSQPGYFNAFECVALPYQTQSVYTM